MSKTCCRGPYKALNLGCGDNKLPAPWINTDEDIRSVLSAHQSNSVDKILVEHVVEHLTGPEMLHFFDECHRVLRDGSILRICVPILRNITDNNHRRDLILGHGHLQVLSYEALVWTLLAAGFPTTYSTERNEIDGHHKVIGVEKDDIETLRMEARK